MCLGVPFWRTVIHTLCLWPHNRQTTTNFVSCEQREGVKPPSFHFVVAKLGESDHLHNPHAERSATRACLEMDLWATNAQRVERVQSKACCPMLCHGSEQAHVRSTQDRMKACQWPICHKARRIGGL